MELDTIVSQFEFDDNSRSFCIDDNLVLAFMKDNEKNTSALEEILTRRKKLEKKFLMSLPPHVGKMLCVYLLELYQFNFIKSLFFQF